MLNLVTLAHRTVVQSVYAADSYAVTVARMMFAREQGVPPSAVDVSIEPAEGLFDRVPTPEELAIVNAV